MQARGDMKFTVVGAGITGLSSAYRLARRFPGCHITVIYDKGCPDTTSNHGFGICSLRSVDDYDSPNTPAWSKETSDYCKSVVNRSPVIAKEMGINATVGYLVEDRRSNDVALKRRVSGTFEHLQEAEPDELDRMGFKTRCREMNAVFERENVQPEDIRLLKYGSWVVDNHSYLPWLKKELDLMKARGEIASAVFVQKRLKNLSEAVGDDCDIVVNCSGLGAGLLASDENVVPIRGQYILLRPKKDLGFIMYGGHTFMCPKPGRIALGSVYQVGRADTNPDPRDREDILRRNFALRPELKDLEIIGEDVGIRPGRKGGPRVELECKSLGIPVIHNYGHGAKGILQHWGCAGEVERLAAEYLERRSKL